MKFVINVIDRQAFGQQIKYLCIYSATWSKMLFKRIRHEKTRTHLRAQWESGHARFFCVSGQEVKHPLRSLQFSILLWLFNFFCCILFCLRFRYVHLKNTKKSKETTNEATHLDDTTLKAVETYTAIYLSIPAARISCFNCFHLIWMKRIESEHQTNIFVIFVLKVEKTQKPLCFAHVYTSFTCPFIRTF